MRRDTSRLADREFDLLVIGGGIFGACAAWDAALRGLRVALIEKDDFGGGASANCFKVVHGGIRYLQHANIRRLRNSCFERSAFLRIAPHLVEPLPIVVPTYGHFRQGKAFLGAGMRLYDALTLDRNRGIADETRHIPPAQFLRRRQTLDLFPDIESDGLTGAAVFCDGQMFNPTRLVLAFIRSADDAGATVCNYVSAHELIESRGRIAGARATDVLTGEHFPIHARVTLNAAGPWAENLIREGTRNASIDSGVYSRDACFVVKRRFEHGYGLAVQGRTRDPGAVVSRPGRHLFMMPWRDYTLIGVWHVVWRQGPEAVSVGADELRDFMDEINWAYPKLGLRPDDVTMWNAGLVPFGENEAGATDLRYGEESRIIDHRTDGNVDGLVTLIGIRYTMGRVDAAAAVDLVMQKLGLERARAPTHQLPVFGGDIPDLRRFTERVSRDRPHGLAEDVVEAILRNHGTAHREVFDEIDADEQLREPVGDEPGHRRTGGQRDP